MELKTINEICAICNKEIDKDDGILFMDIDNCAHERCMPKTTQELESLFKKLGKSSD